jgi:hypothetical protein
VDTYHLEKVKTGWRLRENGAIFDILRGEDRVALERTARHFLERSGGVLIIYNEDGSVDSKTTYERGSGKVSS